jgi:hypothetical protein
MHAGDARRLVDPGLGQSAGAQLEEVLASANDRLMQTIGRSELLRALESEIVASLRARGVDVIVLKGTTFADQLYPDAALRPFSDIDLLVPEAAVPDARRNMAALGLRSAAQNVEKYIGRYAEEKWLHPTLQGALIELHWDLVGSPRMRNAVSLTYEDLLPLIKKNRGQSACALLLVAAIHGTAGHGFELFQQVIDVAQAARGAAGKINPTELMSAAKTKGQRFAVEAALTTVSFILGDEDCARLALTIEARPSAWLLPRILGVAAVVEARGVRHSRHSWRRQLYREALIRLALKS